MLGNNDVMQIPAPVNCPTGEDETLGEFVEQPEPSGS